MSDRAVSDVLGYAIVFALIVSMVGVVYTTGISGLTDAREFEQMANAERAFDVLDANIEDLTRGTAPVRGTEIKLQDASLGFGDPVTINVSVEGEGSYTGVIQPIYFEGASQDTRIVSSNGAVFRQSDDGTVVRSEPDVEIGERTVIPMIVTQTRDSELAGSGRVLVRTVVADRTVVHFPANESTVNVTVNSSRAEAWASELSSNPRTTCDVSGEVATCTIDTESVYVQIVRVDVSLI